MVPDVRFHNEVEAVETEEDSILAKVVRPGYGPKNTKADRALLGYNGWNFIIGGSGRMDELHSWGARLAAYVAGTGSLPFQSDDDRRFCMSVEVLS